MSDPIQTRFSLDIDLGRDADEVRNRIIRQAAREMLFQVTPYNDEAHFTKLANWLRGDISKAIRAEVEKAVAPAVREALDAGVQPTDQYGEPRGEKTTLRNVIVKEAERALSKKVEVRDNYGRSESVVQQVVRDEVQKALADELKAAIKEEREKVQAAVRGKAAEIITESVKKAVPF